MEEDVYPPGTLVKFSIESKILKQFREILFKNSNDTYI